MKKKTKVPTIRDLKEGQILVKKPIVVNWEEEIECIIKRNGKIIEWSVPLRKLLGYLWLTEPTKEINKE